MVSPNYLAPADAIELHRPMCHCLNCCHDSPYDSTTRPLFALYRDAVQKCSCILDSETKTYPPLAVTLTPQCTSSLFAFYGPFRFARFASRAPIGITLDDIRKTDTAKARHKTRLHIRPLKLLFSCCLICFNDAGRNCTGLGVSRYRARVFSGSP